MDDIPSIVNPPYFGSIPYLGLYLTQDDCVERGSVTKKRGNLKYLNWMYLVQKNHLCPNPTHYFFPALNVHTNISVFVCFRAMDNDDLGHEL
jgi:hypothetical protein